MADATCPDLPTLEQLLLGQTPEDEAAALEHHLAACPRCTARLDELDAEDELVVAMRGGPPALAEADGDRLGRLVNRMRGLCTPLALGDTPRMESAPREAAPAHAFLDPPETPDEIGRLGPYRVCDVLGSGGMGVVFRAEDVRLRREVAQKVILDGRYADPRYRARFEPRRRRWPGFSTRTSSRSTKSGRTTAARTSPWSTSLGGRWRNTWRAGRSRCARPPPGPRPWPAPSTTPTCAASSTAT